MKKFLILLKLKMQTYQDWKPLVFVNPKKTENKIVEQHQAGFKTFKKLDSDNPELPKILGSEAGKMIQKARCELKLTQEQLANKICVKPGIVKEYEIGNIIPNRNILNKLNKALNIKIVYNQTNQTK